jgi:ribosomal protein L37AE/L43A
MKSVQDFFLCDSCKNKDFVRVQNFSIRFHGVNFSDDLIYDRSTIELYQCTKCGKVFSMEQVEEGLSELKRRLKTESSGSIKAE